MKNPIFAALFLAAAGTAAAQAPAAAAPSVPAGIKIGVLNAEAALLQTRDGQAARAEMEKKFGPRGEVLQKAKADVDDLQNRLERGGNTMSQATKDELQRQIQTKTRNFQRDVQDFQDEEAAEEQKIRANLGEKMEAVVTKFAVDNGISLILNVAAENTPVVYLAQSLDITQAIIEAYDKAAPMPPKAPVSTAPKAPATSSPKPAANTPAAPKPPAVAPARP